MTIESNCDHGKLQQDRTAGQALSIGKYLLSIVLSSSIILLWSWTAFTKLVGESVPIAILYLFILFCLPAIGGSWFFLSKEKIKGVLLAVVVAIISSALVAAPNAKSAPHVGIGEVFFWGTIILYFLSIVISAAHLVLIVSFYKLASRRVIYLFIASGLVGAFPAFYVSRIFLASYQSGVPQDIFYDRYSWRYGITTLALQKRDKAECDARDHRCKSLVDLLLLSRSNCDSVDFSDLPFGVDEYLDVTRCDSVAQQQIDDDRKNDRLLLEHINRRIRTEARSNADCEAIITELNNHHKQSMLDVCLAVVNNAAGHCAGLEGSGRTDCYTNLAVRYRKPEFCSPIDGRGDADRRGLCFVVAELAKANLAK